MQQALYQPAGTAIIDGKQYRIVRDPEDRKQQAYRQDFADEPPWESGLPSMVSDPQYTWHAGGFKSRQGVAGTSEYGHNTDARWLGRLLPGPKINDVVLTSATVSPVRLFEANGLVYAISGTRVYRITNATPPVVTLSKTFTKPIRMGISWESDEAVVTEDEIADSTSNASIWSNTTGAPDTWTEAATAKGFLLAKSMNRFFKIGHLSNLKNLSTGLALGTETNWADEVQIGKKVISDPPQALVSYERTVFTLKMDGLYGVGEDPTGFGVPISRKYTHVLTGKGMVVIDPYIFIPHDKGLYRFQPGVIEDCGIEEELLNQSPVTGMMTGLAASGKWIYAAMAIDGGVHVLVGREAKGDEPGFGPLIWDTLMFINAHTVAPDSVLVTGGAKPRLWFATDTTLHFVDLGSVGGPDILSSDYRFTTTSGDRYTPRYRFDDWNTKTFPQFRIAGRNLSAAKKWAIAYRIDGGAWLTTDLAGAAMEIIADGIYTFQLPTTASGREIQYRFTFTNDSETVPPEINYWEPFAIPQSKKIPLMSVFLALEPGLRHERSVETREVTSQLNDLIALVENSASIVTTGPWGKDVNCLARKLRIVETRQSGVAEPQFIVELLLQQRN